MKLILFLIFFPSISIFGQNSFTNKEISKYACSVGKEQSVHDYFGQFEEQQDFISKCEIETEKRRTTLNQPKSVKVSGFGPRAISLVKPYYPTVAKELKISDVVLIEVLTNERGFVISSKPLRGHAMFYQSARKAACASRFTPVLYCEKPIKARWLIRYNFLKQF